MAEKKRERQEYPGKCAFCGAVFPKGTMTNHLKACPKRDAKPGSTPIYHLAAEGQYMPEYWLHVEMPATATLGDLDGFLRHIWVECCDHLSAFRIGRTSYEAGGDPFGGPLDEFGEPDEDDEDDEEDDFEERAMESFKTLAKMLGMKVPKNFPAFGDSVRSGSMKTQIGKVLEKGTKFLYEYDFGSTTHITLRVIDVREGKAAKQRVALLARNEPPAILCDACKKEPAVAVCTSCSEGWLCKKCAKKHECGAEGLLPVVNSPRVGVCGYTGTS
jgi:ribosomal protein L37AE/L43A